MFKPFRELLNIDIDRDIRGMARVKNYFVKLDPGLENFFVNDIPRDFLTGKGFGMRRSAEIIVGFLVGIAAAALSSYFSLSLEINIMIAIIFTVLTSSFLEFFARRKLVKALGDARKEEKVNINVIAD